MIHDLKQLVGRDNDEFKSNKMADSLEYLRYFLSKLQKAEKAEGYPDFS